MKFSWVCCDSSINCYKEMSTISAITANKNVSIAKGSIEKTKKHFGIGCFKLAMKVITASVAGTP